MSDAKDLPGRAVTPGQKRAVIERLYAAWLHQPQQRLGQLLQNAIHHPLRSTDSSMFNVEDMDLVSKVEGFAVGGS